VIDIFNAPLLADVLGEKVIHKPLNVLFVVWVDVGC
jgi:hypothetical protein